MDTGEFLRELKEQYNKEFEIKNSIEIKSSSLITVSGIVVILLCGFCIFLFEKINTSFDWPVTLLIQVLVIIIFIMSLLSMSFAIWASKAVLYRHVFLGNILHDEQKSEIENPIFKRLSTVYGEEFSSKVMQYKDNKSSTEEFRDTMIESYLGCNIHNSDINEKALSKIRIGQIFFLLGLIAVTTLVVIMIFYSSWTPTVYSSPKKHRYLSIYFDIIINIKVSYQKFSEFIRWNILDGFFTKAKRIQF